MKTIYFFITFFIGLESDALYVILFSNIIYRIFYIFAVSLQQ